MSEQDYKAILRLVGVLAGCILLVLSIYFSSNAFGFETTNDSVGVIAGLGLAIVVTALELIFNKEGTSMNLTLRLGAISAYAYGITTNVIGLYMLKSNKPDDILSAMPGYVFVGVLGFMLEVLPEPLIVWGLTGMSNLGDFIGAMFGAKPAPTPIAAPKAEFHPVEPKPQNGGQKGGNPPHYSFPYPPNQGQKRH